MRVFEVTCKIRLLSELDVEDEMSGTMVAEELNAVFERAAGTATFLEVVEVIELPEGVR
jgi:hypothetical protein